MKLFSWELFETQNEKKIESVIKKISSKNEINFAKVIISDSFEEASDNKQQSASEIPTHNCFSRNVMDK